MVVVSWGERNGFPWTFFNIFGLVDVILIGGLGKSGDIKHSFVVTDTASPGPFAIGAFAIVKIHGIHII